MIERQVFPDFEHPRAGDAARSLAAALRQHGLGNEPRFVEQFVAFINSLPIPPQALGAEL